MYKTAISELKYILGVEFDEDTDYFAVLRSLHSHMCRERHEAGRDHTKSAMELWFYVEKSDVTALRKRRMYMALLLIDFAVRSCPYRLIQHHARGILKMLVIMRGIAGKIYRTLCQKCY